MQIRRELFRDASLRHVEWSARIPAGAEAPPAVAGDGTLYFSTRDGLGAVSDEGENLFFTPRKGLEPRSTPHVDGEGTVYCSTAFYNGQSPDLLAYDAGGHELWARPLGNAREAPVPGPDGTLYFGTEKGDVYRLDAQGQPLWRDTVPDVFGTGDIPMYLCPGSGGELYATDAKAGRLHRFEPDGTESWVTVPDAVSYGLRPTVAPNGDLLLTSNDSRVVRMRPDGTVAWEYSAYHGKRMDDLTPAQREDLPDTKACAFTVPVLSPDGKTAYVAGWNGRLTAVDEDGHARWTSRLEMGGLWRDALQVGEDGTLYCVSESGNVQAMDPADGRALWTYTPPEGARSAHIATRGDKVFLITSEGELHALSSRALHLRAEQSPEEPLTLAVGEGVVQIGGVSLPVRGRVG